MSMPFVLAATLMTLQTPERWENLVMRAGHANFAAGRYDSALVFYRRQQQSGVRIGKVENWLPELIATVERRRDMGAIAPADTHRVGVIFVRQNADIRPDGERRYRADVTDAHIALWRDYLGTLRQLVETWSGGGLTLSFIEQDAVATRLPGDTTAYFHAEHLGLEEWFAEHVEDLDSYFTFSRTTTAHAGSDRYPLLAGVVNGPDRGFLALNPEHDWTFMVHEFFHTMEAVSDVRPMHGYRDSLRVRIPEWTGVTEFDYYRWRFATTFAPRWSRLNYRARFAPMPAAVRGPALALIRAAYDSIPLARRRLARVMADSGRAARTRRDSAEARRLYGAAIALSPYDPFALREINELDRRQGTHPLSERVATIKDADEFIDTDRVAQYGTIVGTWRPTQIRQSVVELSWDVSEVVTGAGTWEATLWYRDGWRAIRIDRVALLQDGREVAHDAHVGRSGTRLENITYALRLAAHRPGARYTITARVAGLAGEDSNGLVLVRRATTNQPARP